MAVSTCIKCGGHFFENKVVTPKDSNFNLTFVQCVTCGGVVGVIDCYNIGAELATIKRHLGIS
jgi:hypothetical protein